MYIYYINKTLRYNTVKVGRGTQIQAQLKNKECEIAKYDKNVLASTAN